MSIYKFCDYDDVKRRVPQLVGAMSPEEVDGYIEDAAAYISNKTKVTTAPGNIYEARRFKQMNAIMASYEIANTFPHTLRARDFATVHYPLPTWERMMDDFWMEFMPTAIKTHTVPLGETTY